MHENAPESGAGTGGYWAEQFNLNRPPSDWQAADSDKIPGDLKGCFATGSQQGGRDYVG